MSDHTALVLKLTRLHGVIRPFLAEHSPAAAAGLEAHITLLFPFLPLAAINEACLIRLHRFFRRRSPVGVSLISTAHFPGVLYLTLANEKGIRQLVRELRAEFPDLPPTAGKYSQSIPHVTIARADKESTLNRLEDIFWQQYRPHFPFALKIKSAALIHEKNGRLRPIQTFIFGA